MLPDYEKAAELLIEKCDKQTERIEELEIENGKLNIILYHRENGLSHADFNAEIEISKQSERVENLEQLLIEYGRHSEGCSAPYGYPCRCGWDREKKQALKS